MSFVNSLPTDRAATMAALCADQGAGASTAAWVDAAQFRRFLATVFTGVLGSSATVDFKIRQALDGSGTTPKDVPGAAITQIVKASGDNKVAQINLDTASLDVANGYRFVSVIATVGVATSFVGSTLQGFDPFNGPASQVDPAADVQIVSC